MLHRDVYNQYCLSGLGAGTLKTGTGPVFKSKYSVKFIIFKYYSPQNSVFCLKMNNGKHWN